jgi:hypothetical protein
VGKAEVTITDHTLTDFRPASSPSADDLAAFAPRRRMSVKVRVQRASETPRWLRYVIGRLRELQRLVDEPDDEVPTPYPEALERALPELVRFMQVDTPTPSVVPTYNGNVQFVWHKGGWDVEVEVGSKETLVWAQRRGGDASWDGSLDDHVGELRALMAELDTPA